MRIGSQFVFVAAASAALVLGWSAGCGSSSVEAQATIGPSGGSLSLPGEGIRLELPAGALQSATLVTLRASSDSRGVVVGVEPAQLGLAHAATLAVSFDRPVHISSVTELSGSGERPIGVDARVESATGASTRIGLLRFTQIRVSLETALDGGMVPGACRERDDDEGEGDDEHGEHRDGGGLGEGGEHEDGGVADADGDEQEHADGGQHQRDGGVPGSMACASGFECDDGVCVAPGGNHEHDDDCEVDGGTCRDDEHCDGGTCERPDDDRDAGQPQGPGAGR